MLSTKKALPSLTKSIIFAMAATVSMSASAGDVVLDNVAADQSAEYNSESSELFITEGDAVIEPVEMTEAELAEKAAMEKELMEKEAEMADKTSEVINGQ